VRPLRGRLSHGLTLAIEAAAAAERAALLGSDHDQEVPLPRVWIRPSQLQSEVASAVAAAERA
jgi:hypothetical protein